MIRPATAEDLDAIVATYAELLDYEAEHGSFSNWEKGIYPTRDYAFDVIANGDMYVLEEDDAICASMVFSRTQAPEYADVPWKHAAPDDEVLVSRTLCIPPSQAHKHYGLRMVEYAKTYAKILGATVIRMDIFEGNRPAQSLYAKCGFTVAGTGELALTPSTSQTQTFMECFVG
ncbi:GNAT family N-acetyltransferase [Slackia exigua]|uniref:GNAT family N-acetyltransferase n=1 Tax=Slackia exigua TaxID=84109 RepID=UPI0028D68476|nr:GNAT family N-acetyltransferase [Slackia exigua]